jgi:hypothetical protein
MPSRLALNDESEREPERRRRLLGVVPSESEIGDHAG